MKPEAEKVEFNYTENVTASWYQTVQQNGYTFTLTNIDNDANGTYHNCASSYMESNGGDPCGYNGKQVSNPNYECGK